MSPALQIYSMLHLKGVKAVGARYERLGEPTVGQTLTVDGRNRMR